MNSKKIGFALLAFFFVLGCQSSSKKVASFTLGFIPTERVTELTPKAEKLAAFLTEKMGIKVNIVVPTSYEPLMEGLRFRHLDAAFMDSGPGWLAHQSSGAEVVLAELKDGSPYYFGEIFVRKDSDIEKLEDLTDKRIAFTSWTGSSGFILPMGTLVKKGILKVNGNEFTELEASLQKTFKQYVVAGGYKQALKLLVEGKVDVASGAHDAPERFLSAEDRSKLKTLARIGKVPSHPVVLGKHVPKELRSRFVEAMLLLNRPENRPLLKTFMVWKALWLPIPRGTWVTLVLLLNL